MYIRCGCRFLYRPSSCSSAAGGTRPALGLHHTSGALTPLTAVGTSWPLVDKRLFMPWLLLLQAPLLLLVLLMLLDVWPALLLRGRVLGVLLSFRVIAAGCGLRV